VTVTSLLAHSPQHNTNAGQRTWGEISK